jgi:hypothetical protein
MPDFRDGAFVDAFLAGRCFGPLFAAAVTAVMNRSQPSGRNSSFGATVLDNLVMRVAPKKDQAAMAQALECRF